MRKSVSYLAALALVFASVLSFAPVETNAQGAGVVSSVLNRLDQNRRSLKSLRAGVVMQKYNAQIRDADMSFGSIVYQPAKQSANVRVEWTKPQQEILAVRDGKYTLFKPRIGTAYEGNANSKNSKVSSVLGFGLNVSGAELRRQFDVEPLGKKEIEGAIVDHIKLTPRGKASYQYAEIWVDGSGMPIQTRVVERNGDMTTVRLEGVRKNAPVAASDFQLDLPGNVKRVRA